MSKIPLQVQVKSLVQAHRTSPSKRLTPWCRTLWVHPRSKKLKEYWTTRRSPSPVVIARTTLLETQAKSTMVTQTTRRNSQTHTRSTARTPARTWGSPASFLKRWVMVSIPTLMRLILNRSGSQGYERNLCQQLKVLFHRGTSAAQILLQHLG